MREYLITTRVAHLEHQIGQIISRSGAETVAVAARDLVTGSELMIAADASLHPASTMKLCVMAELFRQAHAGVLSLADLLKIKNQFASIADGSPFAIAGEDDSETTLYGRIGECETLRELNRLMIVRSSNLATNLLVEMLGAEYITNFMREIGAPGLVVRRGVEDNKAFALGLSSEATAAGLAQLLTVMARRQLVSEEASEEMIQVLLGQEFNEGIPAGLPPGMECAHKTGWNVRLYHDAAIVGPNSNPYVLAIMTRGIEEDAAAYRLVADISAAVYRAFRAV